MREDLVPTPNDRPRSQRLLFVAGLFGVLLNFPLLGVVDHGGRVAGVPVLYWYILLSWAALIGLTGWLVSKKS